MRLSRSHSDLEPKENQKLGSSRKKHKRLDAICEQEYNRNHRAAVTEANDCNVAGVSAGNDGEVRRSSRLRRAPEVLDASPRPSKKRRKVNRNGVDSFGRVKKKDRVKGESSCSTSQGSGDGSVGWRSRLRSRAKNSNSSPKGKRKLFQDYDELSEEVRLRRKKLDGTEEELQVGRATVVKSKRPGRIKASKNCKNVPQHIDSCSDKELDEEKDVMKQQIDSSSDKEDGEDEEKDVTNDSCSDKELDEENDIIKQDEENEVEKQKQNMEVELSQDSDEEETLPLENDGVILVPEGADANNIHLAEEPMDDVAMCSPLEDCIGNDNGEGTEQETQLRQSDCMKEGENQADLARVDAVCADPVEDGGCSGKRQQDESSVNAKVDCALMDKLGRLRTKEGRKCGLCGTGSDGKPPKKLIHDGIGSDHEAYSGSSAAEEFNYDVWDGFGEEPSWLGRLLGPINDRNGIAGIWVHQQCAVWSPEVYFAGLGCLKNIRAALCRGRVLKCNRCRRSGATIGCRVDRCPRTYHLPCARANGCIFDHRKFLIACTKHRYLFQPQGSQYHQKIKKMKAKKMKSELRKRSSDALRKDLEAEEKWLENCGEDEEFLKRESKRLHRDLLRIAPVYIGGSNSENETQFQGWESVAGLQNVIQCMKEVVILPLLYPEFFSNMGITPPRGVLLHGYPGTGKTLVVRSLIGSCARGGRRIAYFARKGADCLGKYVGDAERQLRLLFQVAEKSQPSIIFFDEIDGLAPCRTRQQDQTHNSVVSTLLALLDGLKSRGSVVVIGATNRPDAVDPALRRPGRFDREIYFPLPAVEDRAAILSLHTEKWPKPVTGPLLYRIAKRTVGFAGADLQALCTQTAIIALRRNCPFQELLSEAEKRGPNGKRASLPTFSVEERDWLEALSCAPPPCSQREAGMATSGVVSSPLHRHLIPCLLQPLTKLLVSLYLDERLSLSPLLHGSATLIKGVMVSALNKKNVSSDCWWSLAHNLLEEEDVQKETVTILSRGGILHGQTCSEFDACGEDTSDSFKFKPPNLQRIESRTSLLQNISSTSVKNLGFRMLISGSPGSGQRYLASCILHCFVGNVELQKIDLATVSQEGHGDVVQGITQVLMRCSSVRSCMIFMPRIDLWAIETCNLDKTGGESPSASAEAYEDTSPDIFRHMIGKENESSQEELNLSESAVTASYSQKVSHFWSLFAQQVESIRVSTSLMIVATSEVPFPALPLRIRQFFKDGLLDCSSTLSEETIPRFSVDLDGNFDSDAVINLSAAELLTDLVGEFIQLVHHRTHVFPSSCRKNRSTTTLEGVANEPIANSNPGSASEQQKSLYPESSVMNLSCTPQTSKSLKIKSSLLLAISTFGYQILRYPNFAELCWVTSKLRGGPSADISGPWKGWPFNSCVVRPNNTSVQNGAVACSTSNIKSKESFGLVRGLTAVALSAYRGVYTSLREVSFEVRKVLELLAEEVHAKSEAGKDRCHFIRILSQMAYFEDMVNSWAYTLQSIDADAPTVAASTSSTRLLGTVDNRQGCKVNTAHDVGRIPDASTKTSHKVGVAEESNRTLVAENGAPEHMVISPSTHDLNSAVPAQLDLNQSKHGKYSNGFPSSEAVFIEPDGPFRSEEARGKVVPPVSESPQNGTNTEEEASIAATDSRVVCFYRCCGECVFKLGDVLHTILSREWKLKNGCTVEDVHDMVASLLVDLNSVIRRRFLADDYTQKLWGECSCHSTSTTNVKKKKKRKTQKAELSCKYPDMKFICRDGVMSVVEEAHEEVPCHCKFQTLCLSSLTEWIVTAKQPREG